MTITIEQVEGEVSIIVLGIQGDLDASNYQKVIDTAKKAYELDVRNLLIDMTSMPFMSSSGLVALHSVALLMRGEDAPDPEHGWAALHAIDQDKESGVQKNVKLLNPQSRLTRTLKTSGLSAFFEIHTDMDEAIASFG